MLYVLHEAIHLPQGLGDKESVRRLRGTGAELTLMHCDLAADHGAACLGAQLVPGWRLRWLKELQGQTLAAFPLGPHHGAGARLRKCRRLAALRLDWQARELGLIAPEDGAGGYCWGEYRSEGGELLLFQSAPLPRIVCGVLVQAEEALVFDQAPPPRDMP